MRTGRLPHQQYRLALCDRANCEGAVNASGAWHYHQVDGAGCDHDPLEPVLVVTIEVPL